MRRFRPMLNRSTYPASAYRTGLVDLLPRLRPDLAAARWSQRGNNREIQNRTLLAEQLPSPIQYHRRPHMRMRRRKGNSHTLLAGLFIIREGARQTEKEGGSWRHEIGEIIRRPTEN
jgi:hypothetical protein